MSCHAVSATLVFKGPYKSLVEAMIAGIVQLLLQCLVLLHQLLHLFGGGREEGLQSLLRPLGQTLQEIVTQHNRVFVSLRV